MWATMFGCPKVYLSPVEYGKVASRLRILKTVSQ